MRVLPNIHGVDGRYAATHNQTDNALYGVWGNMIDRCENPNCKEYFRYGARGIKVCAEWRSSFLKFVADMGDRPEGTTIERLHNDRDYEPGNCRWATWAEQAQNRRNTPRINGMSPRQISDMTGLPMGTVQHRFKRGWSAERIISQPWGRSR